MAARGDNTTALKEVSTLVEQFGELDVLAAGSEKAAVEDAALAIVDRRRGYSASARLRAALLIDLLNEKEERATAPSGVLRELRGIRDSWAPPPHCRSVSAFASCCRRNARLDIGMGGISDLPPVDSEVEGSAVSLALRPGNGPAVGAVAEPRNDWGVVVRSQDLAKTDSWEHWSQVGTQDAALPFLAAIVSEIYQVAAGTQGAQVHGLTLSTYSKVRSGSGLGISGALACATIEAVSGALGLADLDSLSIGLRAEMQVGTLGGWEDLAASSISGDAAYLKFRNRVREIHAFDLQPAALDWLQRSLLIVETKTERTAVQGGSLWPALQAYLRGNRCAVGTVKEMVHENAEIYRSLSDGEVEKMARLSEQQWRKWCKLTGDSAGMDAVREVCAAAGRGVIAAKLCGAGGGGHVLMWIDPAAHGVARSNLEVRDFRLLDAGLGRGDDGPLDDA